MEFELLSEQIEWEMRRIAAAFWVEEWEVTHVAKGKFCGYGSRCDISWRLQEETASLGMVQVQKGSELATRLLQISEGVWSISTWDSRADELMARGLFRLGFEDANVLAELPVLTATEQMELRLSLPREFWPKTWLGEAS